MKTVKAFLRRHFARIIDYLQIFFGKADKTYAGEFETLQRVLEQINLKKHIKFVDIGAGDGYNMSIAWPLSKSYNARGLLIDANVHDISFAKSLYRRKNFGFYEGLITPQNVVEVIRAHDFEDLNYLKIDIDSFDLEILRSILKDGLLPAVFSIEINEIVPPPVVLECRFSEVHSYKTPFFGCSLQAAINLALEFDYYCHSLAFNNAFFVKNEIMRTLQSHVFLTADEIYLQGYKSKNWKMLFPWNRNYEDWIESEPDTLIDLMKSHKDFDATRMDLYIHH